MPQKGHRKCRHRHVYQYQRGVHSLHCREFTPSSLSDSVIEFIQKYRVIFPLNKELCTHKYILVYLRLLPPYVLQNEPISCLRVASIILWKEVSFHASIPDYLKLSFIQIFFFITKHFRNRQDVWGGMYIFGFKTNVRERRVFNLFVWCSCREWLANQKLVTNCWTLLLHSFFSFFLIEWRPLNE